MISTEARNAPDRDLVTAAVALLLVVLALVAVVAAGTGVRLTGELAHSGQSLVTRFIPVRPQPGSPRHLDPAAASSPQPTS